MTRYYKKNSVVGLVSFNLANRLKKSPFLYSKAIYGEERTCQAAIGAILS
jgi:hypothetical protein